MKRNYPFKLGAAFATTVAIGYALCTLAFYLWPESAATFMNALFHGLDFRKLQSGSQLFNFSSFAYGLLVLTGWAFMLGTIFGWLEGIFTTPIHSS